MPVITDKFGKASINTDVAVATTVKTTRLPGVFVLEAYDLSKYATDTPVFVVTYKKTTDPVTNITSITNLTSWKALVNAGANTLTNLTVQPGYSDTGNAQGDFIECIPTSAWENSLIDGILTSLNPDGTLKTSAVQAALNITGGVSPDWTPLANTPVYDTAYPQGHHLLRYVGADYTAVIQPGTKLRIPRTGTPPTMQAQIVSASSQYFRRTATLTGITFTGDFSIECNLRTTRMPNGETRLLNRDDAAGINGWATALDGDNRPFVFFRNGSGYTLFRTEQSLKLHRDYHVAWVVNVSAKTAQIYIDGEPWQLTSSESTSATGMVQGTAPLNLGNTAATSYADIITSEWRLWNIARTQQQILDNKDRQLIGTETNLIGLWHFNGDANDSTSNANHFTSSGGALANYAGNALSSVEYAVAVGVQKVGSDTLVDVFSGNGRIPKETLGSSSWSSAAAPFGFPLTKNHWRISLVQNTPKQIYIGAFDSWIPSPFYMRLQMGKWNIGFAGHWEQNNTSAAAGIALRITLEKDGFSFPQDWQKWWAAGYYDPVGVSGSASDFFRSGRQVVIGSTPEIWRIYGNAGIGGGSVSFYMATGYAGNEIWADCALVQTQG